MLCVLVLLLSGCWDVYLHHHLKIGGFDWSWTMEIAPMPICIESADCSAKPYRPPR